MRFSEFSDEWENKKLGALMTFKVTNSYSRDNLNYESGTIKNIHYGDIHTKFRTLFDLENENVPYINEDISLSRISEDFYCQEGDVIFADASEDLNDVGKSIEITNLNGEKLLSGLHTLLARPQKKYFSKGFLGFLLKSDNVRNQIKREAQGSKVLSINVGRISNIHLSFPSFSEQHKISEFLSLLDERIQTQKKIIEDLQITKKEISIKLFKEGFNSSESKKENFQKLGELTYIVNKKNKENLKLPVYSINNKKGFVSQSEQFEGIDSDERGYDISLYKIIGKETFAYNPARINVGSIGYSGNLENIIISSLYVCFKTTDTVDDEFLFQYLRTDIFRKEVLRNVEGGVRDYLFYENFSRIKINLPDLKEQIKIAKFLSKFDEKVNVEIELLTQYENQKKYLLQNLFV
ncbi:type I restriction enzyme S subunit [Chryseobacterium flavum]|uniref:restriction endonuclease subunit S n=1 Tax=Chryseobacterium flavum TaxID=415851 RepID=UPI003391C127